MFCHFCGQTAGSPPAAGLVHLHDLVLARCWLRCWLPFSDYYSPAFSPISVKISRLFRHHSSNGSTNFDPNRGREIWCWLALARCWLSGGLPFSDEYSPACSPICVKISRLFRHHLSKKSTNFKLDRRGSIWCWLVLAIWCWLSVGWCWLRRQGRPQKVDLAISKIWCWLVLARCWLGVGSQNLVLALYASTPQPAVVRSRSNLVHSMAHIGPLRMLNLSRIGGGFI